MTIFEYLEKYYGVTVYTDEYGNTYVDGSLEVEEMICGAVKMDTTTDIITYLLPKEVSEKCSEIEILISGEVEGEQYVRRPYYRMRGVPVTHEQAFELIRRTDNFFRIYIDSIEENDEFISCINFDNWLIMKNHYPQGYGWIHVDGTVGTNSIMQRFPTLDEFVAEWYQKLLAFPYLDLIIAVTAWDEGPHFDEVLSEEEFDREIRMGIYVHNRQVEILNKRDTIAKYREYNKRYGIPAEKFEVTYYENHKITQVDLPYLKKCIEAYGLDADKELGKVPEYVWWEK